MQTATRFLLDEQVIDGALRICCHVALNHPDKAVEAWRMAFALVLDRSKYKASETITDVTALVLGKSLPA